METKPAILITGTQVSPEIEEEVSRWYDEVHKPRLLKSGVRRANRYRLISSDCKSYPMYLGIYRFESQQAFDKWNSDPELFEALRKLRRKSFPDKAFDVIWYASYELSNAPRGMESSENRGEALPFVFITGITVAAELEGKLNRWYDEVQAPRLLEPGLIKRAKRYRFTWGNGREYPQYMAIYEFENREAMEKWRFDPELLLTLRARRREEFHDDVYRIMWNAGYELLSVPRKGE